jgi:Domain of unknown function (DUF4178)
MSAESRRMLGYGLLAASAGVTLLMVLWLMTAGVEAGGAVLGLLLLFVLAGPLAAGGYYVLHQGRAERVQEEQFAGKRRVLDADRLFRRELSARLRQLSEDPQMPAAALTRMADALKDSAANDEAAWYGAVQLDDTQVALLRQYDDLVWERLRSLRDHATDQSAAIAELQRAMDQRTDLLVRGRSAPTISPAALLEAHRAAPTGLAELELGDAVTFEGNDYVVEAAATRFADGQTSKLLHLIPSGPGAAEHWLYVTPGGTELDWLEVIVDIQNPGANQLAFGNATLPLVSARSATVEVTTPSASTPGVLVRTWTYRAGPLVAIVEQWPDGATHAYGGTRIDPHQLDIWPANHATEVAKTG